MTAPGALSIRTKLCIGFGVTIALVVAIGLVGYFQLATLHRAASETASSWLPRISALHAIERSMVEHRIRVDAALETAAAEAAAAAKIDAVSDDIGRRWRVYEASVGTAEERIPLSQFVGRWAAYEASTARALESLAAADSAAAAREFTDNAIPSFDGARAYLGQLIAYSADRSADATDRAEAIYANLSNTALIAILVALFCAGFALWWIFRNVSRPIGRVSEAMRRLAFGDAGVDVGGLSGRSDEIGALAAAVEGYRDSLVRGRQLAEEAEMERRRLASAIGNMPVGLVMFDADRRLIFANAKYVEIYRLPPHLARPGTSLREILDGRVESGAYPGDDPDAYLNLLDKMISDGEPASRVMRFRSGRIVNMIFQPTPDGGWVSTHEDVTERQRAQSQIDWMSRHDTLTDLPNRMLFRERLAEMLGRGYSAGLAVLCLDLDHFKTVNDTLGHQTGDRLLKIVADRLSSVIRETDTVARLGGDEFAVIQSGAPQPEAARALGERIIETLSAPYLIDGAHVDIGVSVGVSIAPTDGVDADRLLKNGHIALYRAKGEGRGLVRFFEAEMDAEMQRRRALEVDLRRAVAANAFTLHYQPQICLETNRVKGFEALLRWRHPDRGLVHPGEFVALAEETGLIVPIGEWVLQKACAAAASWPGDIRVGVNLSAVQFRSARLFPAVVAALQKSGLAASRLELEITESVLLKDTAATFAILHQLRELGVHIAMDDFGTGYSSLGYLQRFRFDRIKIDRSFIKDIGAGGGSLAIIRAITTLGGSMGIATTAEGVETMEQLDRVRAEGCTEAQGFLIGRPMPAEEAKALLDGRPLGVAAA